MKKKKTLLSWSSGKDSAWSLFRLQQDPQIDLCGLFSVINPGASAFPAVLFGVSERLE